MKKHESKKIVPSKSLWVAVTAKGEALLGTIDEDKMQTLWRAAGSPGLCSKFVTHETMRKRLYRKGIRIVRVIVKCEILRRKKHERNT